MRRSASAAETKLRGDSALGERPPAGWLRELGWLACSILSGVLVFLSFPPADLGWLGFVAFVPLLVAVGRAPSVAWAAANGAVAGIATYLPAFAWVASVSVPGWIGLSVYVTLYLVAGAVVFRELQRRFPFGWPVFAACGWVGLELCRARLGPGFPWLLLGCTQYRFASLLQLAAVGGVYAISFVVFFVGAAVAALAQAVARARRGGNPRTLLAPAAMAAGSVLLCAVCAVVGRTAMARLPVWEGPVVGIIQQNFPRLVQEIFAEDDPDVTWRKMEEELDTAARLTAVLEGRGVRLVVWPETTVQIPLNVAPELLVGQSEALARKTMRYVGELGRRLGAAFLLGAPSYFGRSAGYISELRYGTQVRDYANSAVLFSPRGAFLGRYDKMRLVPFGEYIPLREQLPFLSAFTPIQRELTPGDEEVVFALPARGSEEPVRFGALICYEDVFSDLTATFRLKGAQFLVNLTDEGWYHIPGELGQHLAMAVCRAVETRTTVVRAANTGISCFIGPRGDVYAALRPHTQGALCAPVRLCPTLTPYVRYGDTFALTCLLVSLAVPPLLAALRRPLEAA